jgi:hypothetical protein
MVSGCVFAFKTPLKDQGRFFYFLFDAAGVWQKLHLWLWRDILQEKGLQWRKVIFRVTSVSFQMEIAAGP